MEIGEKFNFVVKYIPLVNFKSYDNARMDYLDNFKGHPYT